MTLAQQELPAAVLDPVARAELAAWIGHLTLDLPPCARAPQ
ncbi:hypothetical protein [Streptomyces humicola]|nr:hypothetical protein [Streptomyces humicola]